MFFCKGMPFHIQGMPLLYYNIEQDNTLIIAVLDFNLHEITYHNRLNK